MRRLLKIIAALAVLGILAAAVAGAAVYLILVPQLPEVETLRDTNLQEPLRVYTRDGELIAEYGEQRRIPLRYQDFPPRLVEAVVAAEDDRFFTHPGVDYQGLMRAVWYVVRTGEMGPGGSTITMQVARNFFLTREKTILRKLNEILLALKIERELSKEEILELYLNKIFLGHRSYGVGAAAQVYYGRAIDELTLAEYATLAGLPQAPSAANPISNPSAALQRRAYVLRRMLSQGYIDTDEYRSALAEPIAARRYGVEASVRAPYVAEMARAEMVARYGAEAAYTGGYRVYTTIDREMQEAANEAVRQGLLRYDERHGYRGPLTNLDESVVADRDARRAALAEYGSVGGLLTALVMGIDEDGADIYLPSLDQIQRLPWDGMAWARPFLSRNAQGAFPETPQDVVEVGDVVRVRPTDQGMRLAQNPEPEAALVALSPHDGRLLALTGGFDFRRSSFNRVTQAERQSGSAFKPFIYSAALDRAYTPATIVNDAPVVFRDEALEGTWRPENYSGRFYGPTRLRDALTYSRNLASIRVLQDIGVNHAINFLENFAFDRARLPRNLSLSLGSSSTTPLELTIGYAVFANGGFLVEPWLIDRVYDGNGKLVERAAPRLACEECPEPETPPEDVAESTDDHALPASFPETALFTQARRTLSATNAYLMDSMLRDVVRRGTGRRLLELNRSDLAGKTGTTNEQRDAWFSGYNGDVVATAWVGFDQLDPLGIGETGSSNALPIWLDFMREALAERPESVLPQPEGVVTVRIDSETGYATTADNPRAMFEVFDVNNMPPEDDGAPPRDRNGGGSGGSLF